MDKLLMKSMFSKTKEQNSKPPDGTVNRSRAVSENSTIPNASGSNADSRKWVSKVTAAWNNMKYGLTTVPGPCTFKKDYPIWLLGKLYHAKARSLEASEELDMSDIDENDLQDFYADFRSRIWLTYRTDFDVLAESDLRSDCGWGCMLRTGQMLLAQTLVVLMLGRDWSRFAPTNLEMITRYRQIVQWSGDTRSAPFSLHALVDVGKHLGKKPGDWYGPALTAHIMRYAVQQAAAIHKLPPLAVYVAQDCTVCTEDIRNLGNTVTAPISPHNSTSDHAAPSLPTSSSAIWYDTNEDIAQSPTSEAAFNRWSVIEHANLQCSNSSCINQNSPCSSAEKSPNIGDACRRNYVVPDRRPHSTSEPEYSATWRRSVLVLIPLRLGSDGLNPVYIPALKCALSLPCTVGIMGGKPKHSLYIIGWHDDYLLYLDPHYCQDFVDTSKNSYSTKSFHCPWPKKLAFSKLDPSCAVGFLLSNEKELQNFVSDADLNLSSTYQVGSNASFPLFSIVSRREDYDVVAERRRSATGSTSGSHDFELL